MSTLTRLAPLAVVAAAALAAASCAEERGAAPTAAGGVHPVGWAVKGHPEFHAEWLKTNKFPIASRCAECHGGDLAGGAVGVSCSQANCHAEAPTACTTCHGGNGTPRPATGAHAAHVPFCDTCHQVPMRTAADVERHASQPAPAPITFGGLATNGGAQPSWDHDRQTCLGAYCHRGRETPKWNGSGDIGCNGCHDAPPANHARWARLATTPDSCATCHPGQNDGRHVNGVLDVTVSSCTTCHGENGHPNPPTALDGSRDQTSRGVGAHERHLNPALPDRISKPLACETCHVVPASVQAPGHIDSPETNVRFTFGGSYDRSSASCNVWCHFGKDPGPRWTDNSGAARACDGCHAFPPVRTRAGTPHPSVTPQVDTCRECHVFDPSTHVNGVTDMRGAP